jgi:hypothetical protein
LLRDGDVAPGEGEVVIGGEESDQAEGKAADGLGEAEPIEAGPRRGWRERRPPSIHATAVTSLLGWT